MKLRKILVLALALAVPQLSQAAGLVNDMQSCQGLIDFIDTKLDSAPSHYSEEKVAKVREGLAGYSQYIQREIVTPGLLQATGGDQAKADAFQEQVNAYRSKLSKGYQARFPQERLFMDHAIAVNNCAKMAVPSGQELEALKDALNTMVELARLDS